MDDAINRARKQPPQQDPRQLEAQWKERDQRRLAELLADVLRRLTPYRGEQIHIVQPSPTGEHGGPYGQRFKEIHRQRCWFIKELRRDVLEHRPDLRTVMLFSDDGTPFKARVFKDTNLGIYVTPLSPEPVGFKDYESFVGLAFGTWIDDFEKDLATAIVRYEREAGAAGTPSNAGPKL